MRRTKVQKRTIKQGKYSMDVYKTNREFQWLLELYVRYWRKIDLTERNV